MKSSSWLVLLPCAFFLSFACNQRTDPPPTNRDGISNGTEPQSNGELEEIGREEPRPDRERREPDQNHNDPEYIPPAERSQLGDSKYTVVVGSFDRVERADQLSFELRMLRINNFVDRANGKWHVCVGQYPTRGLAKNILDRVRDKGYYDARVIGPGHRAR